MTINVFGVLHLLILVIAKTVLHKMLCQNRYCYNPIGVNTFFNQNGGNIYNCQLFIGQLPIVYCL